jgi:hypothetical protein
MAESVDLNQLVRERGGLNILPPESPEDGAHRRRKDMVQFWALLAVFTILFAFGLYFFCTGTDGQQKWGQAALTTMLGSALTYAFKK